MPKPRGNTAPRPGAPAKQVNVRVSQSVIDALDAAAYVREYRGLQELVAPELERLAAVLRSEPAVVAAIEAREQRRRQVEANPRAE
jgi:hypothetical protein